MVEDTGLFIRSLGGLPGALVKWFIATIGVSGICRILQGYPSRSAYAKTVVAIFDGETKPRLFRGTVYGRIALEPRGPGEFGWGKVFIPRGSEKTFGEMSSEEKDSYSMRRQALDRLRAYLTSASSQERSAWCRMTKLKLSSLVFSSSSALKLYEYRDLLRLPSLQLSEVGDLDVGDPQILISTEYILRKLAITKERIKSQPFFVEQTVLMVDALKGFPGGITGLIMKTAKPEGICRMLADHREEGQRIAHALTMIGYYYEGISLTWQGSVAGTISETSAVSRGFQVELG